MKATLIHNPNAGFEKPTKEEIIQALSVKNYEVKYVSSKEKDLEIMLKNPGEIVIIAGGDGTVTKVAKYLEGRRIPIGILSIGTANNIASTLKACGLPQLEITKWNLTHRYPYDIGKVKGSWGETSFLESVGFGLLTGLLAESSKRPEKKGFKNRNEKMAFGVSMLKKNLSKVSTTFYHIQLDGKDYSGKYFMVEVMNIKSIGPNILLAPDADPGDGFFNVILLPEGDREHFLKYLDDLLNGSETRLNIKSYRAAHIYITSEEPALHVDDEIVEVKPKTKINITLEANKLEFL